MRLQIRKNILVIAKDSNGIQSDNIRNGGSGLSELESVAEIGGVKHLLIRPS